MAPVTGAGPGWGLPTCPPGKDRAQPPPAGYCPPEPDGTWPHDQVKAALPLSAPHSLMGRGVGERQLSHGGQWKKGRRHVQAPGSQRS